MSASEEEMLSINEAKTKEELKKTLDILGYSNYWDPMDMTSDVDSPYVTTEKQTTISDCVTS